MTEMDKDIINLPIAPLQFVYQAQQDMKIPAYPGPLWHGVFGLSLRKSVCITQQSGCDDCLLLHQCDYSYLFSGPRPLQSEIMTQYQTIPVPHLIRTENAHELLIAKGEIFSIDIMLIGEAIQKLELMIQTMKQVGQSGIGKQRDQAELQEVFYCHPNSLVQRVYHANQLQTMTALNVDIKPQPKRFVLNFQTPYIVRKNRNSEKFDLPALIMAIIRRISLLHYFYTGQRLDADFKALKSVAHQVEADYSGLRWQSLRRYSARRGKNLDVSGFLGNIEFSKLQDDSLWPFLYLGQFLHVGKNASMGFGRYQLIEVHS